MFNAIILNTGLRVGLVDISLILSSNTYNCDHMLGSIVLVHH